MNPDCVDAVHRSKTEPPSQAEPLTWKFRRWARWLGILPSNRRRREMAGIVDILCPDCCEADLEIEFVPEEPMVVRYADGSGFPGAPATAEIIGQTCPCDPDPIRVLEEAREEVADREQMAYDAAMEAKMDAYRERRYGRDL